MTSKLKAVIIALSFPATFALGAWAHDLRVHDAYVQEGEKKGRISAFYDMSADGYKIYLSCLKDDCERERETSNYVIGKADEHLTDEGVKITY